MTMRLLSGLVLAPVLAVTSACAQDPLYPARVAATSALAFTNVNVVPMDRDTVIRNTTVLVREGRIAAIGVDLRTLSSTFETIDAGGRYLVPGLIDMHVHLRRADLAKYRASGITSVRNMWGHDAIKLLIADVAAGTEPGPRIFSASPGVDGTPAQWPFTQIVEQATDAPALVGRLAAEGWTFLKVYQNLRADVYDSVMAAAGRLGIQVVGHVPTRVPLQRVLNAGQKSIEHFGGYDQIASNGGLGTWAWINADTTRMDSLVAMTVAHGTWNTPTLAIYSELARQHGTADRERVIRNRRVLVRRLSAAGGRLLAGTDAGIDVVPPGSTINVELEEFVAAGLTPYRALRAATRDAAEFLGQSDLGVIAVGAKADLVLVNANPLTDIRALRLISGVVFAGSWFSAAALR
jgi:imidazolonepropionase-like amidohydrolase